MERLPRRAFLQSAGRVGIAALASVSVGSSRRGPAVAASSGPTAADWRALAASIDGDLVRRRHDDYRRLRLLFDPRFDDVRPLAIVRASGDADVSEAIRFARRFGLRSRPRSGGHSYVGASTVDDGLVIDVRPMRSVDYDPASGVTTIGAGVKSYDVHTALARDGRSIATGTCPTVGAAGLTLGGGLGVDTRRYGLSCDGLTGLTMVTADSKVRTVGEGEEADLLWASRGGGGGNFGVVTSMSFRTHPAEARGTFALSFGWEHAAAVVKGWAARVQGMARSTWCNVRLEVGVDGSTRVSVGGCCQPGDQHDEVLALERAIGVEAMSVSTSEKSFMDSVRYFGGGSTTPRYAAVSGSDVVASMTETLAQALPQIVRRRASSGTVSRVFLDPLTGAAQDLPANATAFPWRRHLAEVQWSVQLASDPTRAGVRSARGWVNGAHQTLGSESVGAYVNRLEPGRLLSDYYGANIDRLHRIKAQIDPTGFFRSPYTL